MLDIPMLLDTQATLDILMLLDMHGYTGYPYAAGYGYAGPLNLNNQLIAHPNGAVVPLDEPAVAAVRAAHLETQAAEYAASAPIIAAAPVVAAPAIAAAPVVAAAPAI